MKIKIKRFDKSLPLPEYKNEKSGGAAAIDLYCRESVEIKPNEIKMVYLNVAMKIPEGMVMLFIVRSSTPLKKGLIAPHSVGVLDPYFCGNKDEILYEFMNITDKPVKISKGERLVQAILVKTETVEFEETDDMGSEGVGGYVIPPKE